MPSRPMNKARSNDHDFVPPTQYKPGHTKTQPPSFSPLKLIPRFNAMDLNLKNQENLERHRLNMAAQHARFIFVREELVGKSILSCLSL